MISLSSFINLYRSFNLGKFFLEIIEVIHFKLMINIVWTSTAHCSI